ncbi:hypothetical protein ACIBHX_47495 [Nonomuraea sp. NPDC050536]|uniref:hypothetical protein n=1 Tax=Nonomuraea sp. NPDC050536 TaxID=3364366 RepID=UPI0037C9418D
MFFARHQRRRPPDQIMRAITTVDHFAASLDAFHEREVSRADVFHAMHSIMEEVPAVSFQLTGSPGDAYLTELVDDIRREFADRVPILVTPLQPTGRAAELLTVRPLPPDPPSVAPCTVATWPLVGYDGTVYACSRQSLVEPAKPPHLVLGDAAVDSWAEVRKRSLQHPAVRAVRLLGPRLVREKFGRGAQEGGACTTCVAMGGEADEVAHRAGAYLNSPRGALVERLATQLTGRVSARESALACGAAHHASLVELGRSVSR